MPVKTLVLVMSLSLKERECFPARKTSRGLFVAAQSQLIGESCQKIYVVCSDFVTLLPRDCNNPAILYMTVQSGLPELNFMGPALIRNRDNTRRALI